MTMKNPDEAIEQYQLAKAAKEYKMSTEQQRKMMDARCDDGCGKDWRLHRMTIKCRLCGKLGSEIQGAYLTRVNEKGVTGIWECRPVCGSNLPQETLLMMAVETDAAKIGGLK